MYENAMLTRVGILEGIYDGDLEALYEDIRARLLPLWKRLPRLHALRVSRGISADVNAPAIILMVEMDFRSHEDMEVALSSPERTAVREMSPKVFAAFEGELYHLIHKRIIDEAFDR